VSRFACTTHLREGDVTRYKRERRTRKATRNVTTYTWAADATWTKELSGTSQTTSAKLDLAVRAKGNDAQFLDKVAAQLSADLDTPVADAMKTKAAELRAAGDRAIAAGDIEDGELALVRVALLGGDPGNYFTTRYRVSTDELRGVFAERARSAPADKLVATEALPEITHVRKRELTTFAKARFNSTFPPELAQVSGLYYTTAFGSLVAPRTSINGEEVGGGFAPVFSPRVGTALLARIIDRTSGVGFWDDAALKGDIGYAAGKDVDGARGYSAEGTGMYTAVVGVHAEAFQVLAGARAQASIFKLAGTTGTSVGAQYFGDLGVRVSKTASLSAAAWYPTPYGDKRWGAELYLSGQTMAASYHRGSSDETNIQTGYLTLRGEVMEMDACAAHGGECVDVPDYRAWSFLLGFGAVYQ
jgi:hypothetical protein